MFPLMERIVKKVEEKIELKIPEDEIMPKIAEIIEKRRERKMLKN